MYASALTLASLASTVAAFPALQASGLFNALEVRQSGAGDATQRFEPVPVFNANAQRINVGPGSGHEWQAPGPNDLRGPCPGLNAFANHGFLPRNGYATISQFIDACTNVVGMGEDLAGFLAVFGAAIDGDGKAWSIGGTPSVAQGGPVGNRANGISGSHNKYESDASPTRGDLYQSGNNYNLVINQFQQLINASPNNDVNLDTLTAFRSQRFDTQQTTNPYFFNGPFTGVLVQPAAYTFIYRFMANHSAAHPVGQLDYNVLKSWFGVTGNSGSFQVRQGYERIPDNWYRRAQEYPYSIPYYSGDIVSAARLHPKFLNIGGNLGKPNTFTGLDVANFTGGVMNAQKLSEGNNAACLAYQFSTQAQPDVVLPAFTALNDAVGRINSQLGCPQLAAFDKQLLEQFPGYQR